MHGGAQAGGQGDDLLDANAALSSLDLADENLGVVG
jgi:hypothetical protein